MISTRNNILREFNLVLLKVSILKIKKGLFQNSSDWMNGIVFGINLDKIIYIFEHEVERWYKPLEVFEDPRVKDVYLVIDTNTTAFNGNTITINIVDILLDIFIRNENTLDTVMYNIQAINLKMFSHENCLKVLQNLTEEHLDKILWEKFEK